MKLFRIAATVCAIACSPLLGGCDDFGKDLPPLSPEDIVAKADVCKKGGMLAQFVKRNGIVIWVNCLPTEAL